MKATRRSEPTNTEGMTCRWCDQHVAYSLIRGWYHPTPTDPDGNRRRLPSKYCFGRLYPGFHAQPR